jgi:hypothetical protein
MAADQTGGTGQSVHLPHGEGRWEITEEETEKQDERRRSDEKQIKKERRKE